MNKPSQQIDLPIGYWEIFGNWETGQLVITSVAPGGKIHGTVFGDEMKGVFHQASGEIHFSRKMGVDQWQSYTGHVSIIDTGVDVPLYLLAGSYLSFPFPQRSRFGWYATIRKPIA